MANLLPITEASATWRLMFCSILKTPRQFMSLMVLFVLSSLVALITPVIIGRLVDRAGAGDLTDFPWDSLAIIAAAVLTGAILTRAWTFQGQKIGVRLNRDLGVDLVDSSLLLDAQTVEDAGSGDLISRLTDDLDSIRQVLAQGIPEFTYITIYMMVVCLSIFTLNPWLGLVTVPMMVLMIVSLSYFLPRIGKLTAARVAAQSTYTVIAGENIRGAVTVRELGIEKARAEIQKEAADEIFRAAIRLVHLRSWFWAIDCFTSYLPLFLSVIWGSYCVEAGHASWGEVATVSIMLFSMRVNADIFTFWLDRLREMTVTMGRVFGVINLSAQQQQARKSQQKTISGQNLPHPDQESVLICSKVTFGYSHTIPVIQSANLILAANESIALVGRSGSGKTTLARLIAGSLTADSGTITINGSTVGNGVYPTEADSSGRPSLLICTQEAHLFLGTIAENITLAAPAATEAEQLAALHAVGAHWVDGLPAGIHTPVGGNDHKLSHDQIQQIALARIVAANPHVVILDESTTQLDLADARESLTAVMEGRAVIIISHDARIASLAERAVLLSRGSIIAEGPPQDIFSQA